MSEAGGAMAECVMSLYGLARMIGSRDVGPGHLRTAIDELETGHRGHCDTVARGFRAMTAIASGDERMTSAVVAVRASLGQLQSDMSALFIPGRLGASQRLALERNVAEVGARSEALHAHVELLAAGLAPRPVAMSVHDLATGSWARPRTFPCGSARIALMGSAERMIWADPVVLWWLLTETVRERGARGELPTICEVTSEEERVTLRIAADMGEIGQSMSMSMFNVPLMTSVLGEATVAEIVAEHVGIELRVDEGAISLLPPVDGGSSDGLFRDVNGSK